MGGFCCRPQKITIDTQQISDSSNECCVKTDFPYKIVEDIEHTVDL